jgi:hypothetical protein
LNPTFYGNATTVTSLAATPTVVYALIEGYQIVVFGPGSTTTTFTPQTSMGAGYNYQVSIRVDAAGNLYDSNQSGIIEFPPGTTGNSNNGGATPEKTIGSNGTPFAVSPSGTIYQADLPAEPVRIPNYGYIGNGNYTVPTATTKVDVFAAGSTTQTGSVAGPFYSTPMIADASGHLLNVGVVNDVEQFSTTITGTQAPEASFSDFFASTLSSTVLPYDSTGVAIDSKNNLYVASTLSNSIAVFAPGAATPTRTIVGLKTKLYHPQGMAIDAAGNLYVGSVGAGILVFGANANGNVPPAFTDASGAYFLAIGPATIVQSQKSAGRTNEAGSPYGAPLGMARPERGQLTPGGYFARFRRGTGQR